MASLIEDYEYDIFISYRQKDNKHDGWVTKFVENLKGELESTFKEDISIYFDENPHDRLQETHNVDKSLEDKLKCLIFIPILSQTYCDPNSYAWQYEFLTFLRMVEKDSFGKDVKLRSGNVASRLLPIRIHDLEPEDIKLFEKETGSVLRALDFVFKTSTGVSRPLKDNEDHPQDNLNKTFYSDQINKVGHAIKEIILGMKSEPTHIIKDKDQLKESFKEVREDERRIGLEKPMKSGKSKLLFILGIVVLLIVTAIVVYPKIFKRNTSLIDLRSSGERISIVVMPFQNITNDATKNFWQEMIQENLIAYLSSFSNELKVRQTESVNTLIQSKNLTNYASITPSNAKIISQKLDANIFIYGSIQQAGLKLRVNTKLVDTKTEEVLKSFEIDGPNKEEAIFDITDSLRKMVTNFLLISKLGKNISSDFQFLASTRSPDAYRNFIYGNNAFMKLDFPSATKYYLQAIAADSTFYFAALSLSLAYNNQQMYDQAKKWCQKVYKIRDQMPTQQQKMMINWVYAYCFETPNENIKYIQQLLEFDDQVPRFYYNLGRNYNYLDQYDKAIPEFEKALEIYKKWDSKPMWAANYNQLGIAYHKTDQYKKEKKLYKKAEKDFPDEPLLVYRQAVLKLCEGNARDAQVLIEKYKSIIKEKSTSDAGIAKNIAEIYSEAGILDKAEEYYRQSLSFEPENPARISNLAYFLVNKNRNIEEGLELANRALGLIPDDYASLHAKGWGLYKQEKYIEALDILQKSWDLRREKAVYNHEAYLHLEAAKKAVDLLK